MVKPKLSLDTNMTICYALANKSNSTSHKFPFSPTDWQRCPPCMYWLLILLMQFLMKENKYRIRKVSSGKVCRTPCPLSYLENFRQIFHFLINPSLKLIQVSVQACIIWKIFSDSLFYLCPRTFVIDKHILEIWIVWVKTCNKHFYNHSCFLHYLSL